MSEEKACDIVLVDDEALIRQGIKHYLDWDREGFRIVGEAPNGKEALAVIEKTRPHIVLTDIVMPVMDGEELTRRIKAQYPEIEVIILSSFGEFDYVRATFQSGVADYILKPKLEEGELLRILKKTAARIPALSCKAPASPDKKTLRQAMERLLDGYGEGLDEELMKTFFPNAHFCLAGVQIQGRSVGEPESTNAMAHCLEEELDRLALSSAFCMLEPKSGTVLVLLNIASNTTDGVIQVLRTVSRLTEDRFPYAVFALSSVYADAARTADVYRNELLKSFQRQFYFPDLRVVVEKELPPPGQPPGPFPLNRFADKLQHDRYEEAFKDLRTYVAQSASCHGADVFEFKSFLTAIIFNITVLLAEGKHDVRELERVKYAYFNAINDAFSAADAADSLQAFLEEAKRCIGLPGPQGGSNMKMLLDFVDNNYAEPLTLKEMARHFHFNPSYLSSYFAANNKEGFTEYLNKIRTGKAAELLREREATIAEISERVGYSDHSYFSRVFKKATGYSPSEYRRYHAKS